MLVCMQHGRWHGDAYLCGITALLNDRFHRVHFSKNRTTAGSQRLRSDIYSVKTKITMCIDTKLFVYSLSYYYY